MSNVWLVVELQRLIVAATENGVRLVNADIFIEGLEFPDIIQFGGAEIHVHTHRSVNGGRETETEGTKHDP